jgi:hypothetical protein
VPLDDARRYFERSHAEAMAIASSSANMQAEWLAGMYAGGHLEDLQAFRERLNLRSET